MRVNWLAAALTAAGLLAGCSSTADEPAGDTETTTPTPTTHGSLAACLTEHGVPAAPGPGGGPPPGVDETAWRDAMAACSSLAPGPAN